MSAILHGGDGTYRTRLLATLAQNADAELIAVARQMLDGRPLRDEHPRVWAVLAELTRRLEVK